MTRPVRIQLSRKKGFRLQEHSHAVNGLPAVVVSRPSRWGNPITVNKNDPSEPFRAVRIYAAWVMGVSVLNMSLTDAFGDPPGLDTIRAELTGKNLACWCPLDGPCHADVLLDIANGADAK